MQFAYEDGAVDGEAMFLRLRSVTYPDGRVVYYDYDASPAGRLASISDDAAASTKLAQYTYLGDGSVTQVAHPQVSGGLTLSFGSAGTYGGWDRFGRVLDQLWETDAGAALDRSRYTYDRNSNRTSRQVAADGAPANLNLDEAYQHDGLDRLTRVNRGTLDTNQTITDPNATSHQSFTLDATGNWSSFDDNGTTQARASNAANETTAVTGSWVTPAYDAAGNMASGPKAGAEATKLHYTYDAWNRLVKVQADDGSGQPGTTVATYAYDARGFRVKKTVGSDVTDYYYTDNWQLLHEAKNGSASASVQYVWDPRYVDAPVLRDRDTDGNGSLDERLYYTHDASFNATGLVTTAGAVVERYAYDAYGKAAVFDGAWQPRLGSAYGNEVLFAGYRHDGESGLYLSRRRHYHPTLGAWVSRDPAGYVDGNNLLEYVAGRPTGATDPTGQYLQVAAGAAAGAAVNLAFKAGSDLISGQSSSYKDYAAAAAGGAAFGATLAGTGNFTAAGAAGAAASNVTKQVLNLLDGTQKCFDFGSLAADTAIGAGQGMIAGAIGAAMGNVLCPANMLSLPLIGMLSGTASGALQGAIMGGAAGGLEGALDGAIEGAVRGAVSGLAGGIVGFGAMRAAGTLPTGTCFTAGTPILTATGRVPIESLRVGQRVLTQDTKAEGRGADTTAVDSATWRLVTLRMDNPDRSGDVLDIQLLRPLSWLRRFGCRAGGKIVLALAEMELEGPAQVLSVEPCPRIEQGRGRVVTATFTHLNGQVRELKLRGLERPLEPTKQHPFYSEDRQDWAAADDLLPGERLRTANGASAAVEWVHPKPGVHRVYNVEVEHEHEYFVCRLDVLAHNQYVIGGKGAAPKMTGRPSGSPGPMKNLSGSIDKMAAAAREAPRNAGVVEQAAAGVRGWLGPAKTVRHDPRGTVILSNGGTRRFQIHFQQGDGAAPHVHFQVKTPDGRWVDAAGTDHRIFFKGT